MFNLLWVSEAWRIFKRSTYVKKHGVKHYSGNAVEICSKILENCWNGKYFQTSTGHFNEFYVRDFGWSIDSLIILGYQDKVLKTLDYALDIFSKNKRVTTTITPSGKVVDIFAYSPDSLAYLIRCLKVSNARNLVEKYKIFLNQEIQKYFEIVIDKKTGLVRKDRYFSSMKDQAKRQSSCYDNCMTASLAKDLEILNLNNPFKRYDYKHLILDNFWTGNYFKDDLSGKDYIAADANVIPFWLEIFDNKFMLKKAVELIISEGLDKPFPVKYAKAKTTRNFVDYFVSNYEGDAIWMHMGPMYIKIVKQIDSKLAQNYVDKYTPLIEEHHNFLEVFNPDGTPFRSPFYYSDEGMIWSANYLALLR